MKVKNTCTVPDGRCVGFSKVLSLEDIINRWTNMSCSSEILRTEGSEILQSHEVF